MNKPVVLDLFVEDRAHEEFLKPLIVRIGLEEDTQISVRVRSARGGHGRAIQEFQLYQNLVDKGALGEGSADLLVVAIDGNCTTFANKRTEIRRATKQPFSDRLIVACPDPHVERWYLADLDSFQAAVGHRPTVGRKKCVRDYYVNALAKAVQQAGHPPTLGGIEFARELVEVMDLYRAGKSDHSLRAFIDELRGKLRQTRNK